MYVGAVEEIMCVVYVSVTKGGISDDRCDMTSTLCKHEVRKGYLFVLSRARVRRMRRVSISSELLMYLWWSVGMFVV